MLSRSPVRRGDTIIEVLFAIAIFGLVAVMTISLMNKGLADAESNLESTMARNEMNAQAEALRYIHSSYTHTGGQSYSKLWNNITSRSMSSSDFQPLGLNDVSDCEQFADDNGAKSFVLDTSALKASAQSDDTSEGSNLITNTGLTATYPYIGFSDSSDSGDEYFDDDASDDPDDEGELGDPSEDDDDPVNEEGYARGIWVNAIRSSTTRDSQPVYYDFYISACWDSIGSNSPTTLDTVVRLYNPRSTS